MFRRLSEGLQTQPASEVPEVPLTEPLLLKMKPPYLKVGTGKENEDIEMSIARRELHGTVNDFCRAAARLLKYGGLFSAVYRPERTADLLCAMREVKIEPKRIITVYPYVDAPPCLILVEGKSGGSPGMAIPRPLIIYKEHGKKDYTDDMAKIYDCFTLEHIG